MKGVQSALIAHKVQQLEAESTHFFCHISWHRHPKQHACKHTYILNLRMRKLKLNIPFLIAMTMQAEDEEPNGGQSPIEWRQEVYRFRMTKTITLSLLLPNRLQTSPSPRRYADPS